MSNFSGSLQIASSLLFCLSRVRAGVVGQVEEVVHARAVVRGELHERAQGDLPLARLVARVADLRAAQQVRKVLLRQIIVFSQVAYAAQAQRPPPYFDSISIIGKPNWYILFYTNMVSV